MNLSYDEQFKLISFINENSINKNHNTLNESVQTGLSDAILDKMFELTVGKYSKIDFSSIERSRGDVTKIKFYDNLKECINILLDIHSETSKIPDALVVSVALENILSLKNSFEHAFRVRNAMGMMIYNSIIYAIMESTSYLIATSIDFVKETETTHVANIYIESKSFCLVDQLIKFNKCVDDGSILKFMNESEKTAETMQEGAMTDFIKSGAKLAKSAIIKDGATKATTLKGHWGNLTGLGKGIAITSAAILLIRLATAIVPFVREIIYWIYKTRVKISDAAELQAEFLQLNIESLKETNGNEKIISKQEKHIKRFKTIAKTFSLEADKAERDSKKDIENDKVDVSAVVI